MPSACWPARLNRITAATPETSAPSTAKSSASPGPCRTSCQSMPIASPATPTPPSSTIGSETWTMWCGSAPAAKPHSSSAEIAQAASIIRSEASGASTLRPTKMPSSTLTGSYRMTMSSAMMPSRSARWWVRICRASPKVCGRPAMASGAVSSRVKSTMAVAANAASPGPHADGAASRPIACRTCPSGTRNTEKATPMASVASASTAAGALASAAAMANPMPTAQRRSPEASVSGLPAQSRQAAASMMKTAAIICPSPVREA